MATAINGKTHNGKQLMQDPQNKSNNQTTKIRSNKCLLAKLLIWYFVHHYNAPLLV
ncbi:hypothetical protein H6F76_13280 [Leptolyngbya sp. FACHB-321]|uniref:hypothetical protein n=1 Tax=Leptolyngbya sp. FACHB-321 TaxID=2692807 RepID=UPI0016824F81|nr:hypothetical protein [Leptolyngbya sp. FACHB-321]MBD2035991.1 hypothetical protein [Leptolyngbya sp. FACHB-321]